MAGGGKRKTTMAKLNRERKLVEKRVMKQAKKVARKRAAEEGATVPAEPLADDAGQPVVPGSSM